MTPDRSALEEAIMWLNNVWKTGQIILGDGSVDELRIADLKRLQLVCDAAAAHAETMPRSRLVWKVTETSYGRVNGWRHFRSRERAEATARIWRSQNVGVVTVEQVEVPA